MAGRYEVLDAASGRLVREIDCGEPIFSTPVVSGRRVYSPRWGPRCMRWIATGEPRGPGTSSAKS